ncbi:LPXTG cell wall anchor domain-containing protein [Kitasatospora sp. NPDC001540]
MHQLARGAGLGIGPIGDAVLLAVGLVLVVGAIVWSRRRRR